MSEHREPIPSMIYNSAVGGHVTNSQQIIDEDYNLEQKDVNKEVLGVPYNATTPNGMGRIVLKKNDNFKQVVEAQTNGNTIFVIKYDFTLTGDVTIPINCILKFDGGSIDGCNIITNNCKFEGNVLFKNTTFKGKILNEYLLNVWFGIVPNRKSTNYDIEWNRFIASVKALQTKGLIVPGEYGIYSQLNILSYTTIVGSDKIPTLYYFGSSNSSLFYCAGQNINISNLRLERDGNNKHEATGIKLGTNSSAYCIGGSLTNIRCAQFEIGINFDFTWSYHIANIDVAYNVYGIKIKATECKINTLLAEANIIGAYIENGDVIAISGGVLQTNAIGCWVKQGKLQVNGIYFEDNRPRTSLNTDVSPFLTNYPNGADVVCGVEDKYCASLTIESCYIGYSDSLYPSLFHIDKCRELNIIGTAIKNLVTTQNTGIHNSFASTQMLQSYPDYKLSELPLFSKRDFSGYAFGSDGLVVFGGGVAARTSFQHYSVQNGKLQYYSSTSGGDNGRNITLYLEGNYIESGLYTIVVGLKFGNLVGSISVGSRKFYAEPYFNRDIFYKFAVPLTVSSSNHAVEIKVYAGDEYSADNPQNGIIIDTIEVYKGNSHNLNLSSKDSEMLIHTSAIEEVKNGLILPVGPLSSHTFDLTPFESKPIMYFDSLSHKVLVKYNGNIYDTEGNLQS